MIMWEASNFVLIDDGDDNDDDDDNDSGDDNDDDDEDDNDDGQKTVVACSTPFNEGGLIQGQQDIYTSPPTPRSYILFIFKIIWDENKCDFEWIRTYPRDG